MLNLHLSFAGLYLIINIGKSLFLESRYVTLTSLPSRALLFHWSFVLWWWSQCKLRWNLEQVKQEEERWALDLAVDIGVKKAGLRNWPSPTQSVSLLTGEFSHKGLARPTHEKGLDPWLEKRLNVCLPKFPPGVVPDRETKWRLNAGQSLRRKSALSGAWALKLSEAFIWKVKF